MTKVIFHFLIASLLFLGVVAQPLRNAVSQEQLAGHIESTAVGIFFLVTAIITVSCCVCCSAKSVKDLGQQNGISAHHSSNNFQLNGNTSEFTIFPPSSSVVSQPTNYSDDKVTFDPLPEILPQKSFGHHPLNQLQLLKFNSSVHKGLSDWFNESLCDYFPRNKLQYHQELGSCWFGQVVLGEAKGIIKNEPATKVVVKILKQDATPNEYVHFLQEIRPFRDINHPNVIKLLGYCLETNPYLFIMEYRAIDLKAYLIDHCAEAEILFQSGQILRMACDVAAGLQQMHDQDFVHMDLAARNCFITPDNVVKLGGYGTSVQTYKEEYYCQGSVALPLRWCDPDSITCVMNMIETREVTKAGNVWSFGVFLWEILEFGKLPYFQLTDEEVLQKVVLERSCSLKASSTPYMHSDRMYKIMQMCWNPVETRCSIHHIAALINHLYDNKDLVSNSAAFETRWASLQPNSSEQNLCPPTDNIPRVVLKLENEFTESSHIILPYDHSYVPTGNTSPSHDSISNSTGIEFASISPSMQNLRGSLEDIYPFGLPTDTFPSDHITSSNIFVCSAEQSKNSQTSLKLPQSLNVPVSLNKVMSHQECSEIKDDTPGLLEHQAKAVEEKLPEKLKLLKETENLSDTKERDGFIVACKDNCEKGELPQSTVFNAEVHEKEIKSLFLGAECNFDKSSVETKLIDEGLKRECSLSSSSSSNKNTSSSKHILQVHPDDENIACGSEVKENAARDPSQSGNASTNTCLPSTKIEDTFFEESDINSTDCDGENCTNFEHLDDKKLAYVSSEITKYEIECNKKTNETTDLLLDIALHDDMSMPLDESTPCKPILSENSATVDKPIVSPKDESDPLLSICSESSDTNNENAIDTLSSAHSASSFHDNIASCNQTNSCFPLITDENISYSNKKACSTNNSLECEIEPGGLQKTFNDIFSLTSENCTNATKQEKINSDMQNVNAIKKSHQECSEGVPEKSLVSESTESIYPSANADCIANENSDALCSSTKLIHSNNEVICDTLLKQNINESNEEEISSSSLSEITGKRSREDITCQSIEPVILVTECSTSPGSQSGDEYQLDDISSVLKEVEQNSIHDNVNFSSAVQHESIFLDNNGKVPVGGACSSDQADPSEWSVDHMLATCSNYWTERIPRPSNSSKNIEESNSNMKSLSDVVILEDLDTGCEKDIVAACYEPYQDPFETDEVLSVDTETNVAVLLDSHHSVIGFVPSKVDMFTGNREMEEEEILSSSEMQSNLSDFIDNNAHAYVNGYKSSDSASPRSLCSSSTDFSINADQRSETSVDSDLVPDLSSIHSTNECKPSFETNGKISQEGFGEFLKKQYANEVSVDSKQADDITKQRVKADLSLELSPDKLSSPNLHQMDTTVASPGRDAYTPDFESDTDDTSSTGTTCTSTSGSFECLYKSYKNTPPDSLDVSGDENQNKSPVQIFSVTWDRNATPTKSSMKSPEKKGGQMKKSVSFQEEDPPLFSYPPESEGSDDDSRGLDYPQNFLWNIDYSVYADWDFQSSLDLEEIPEDIVEVEDPEEDDEYLSFRYKSLPLRPIQVYTFTDITDDDDYSESTNLKTNLSDIGTMEECADLQEICLERKSDDNSLSSSSSVPNEVCEEVIEIYPNFDDLATMAEANHNENQQDLCSGSDNFIVSDEDFDQIINSPEFKEKYLKFAKPDTSLASEYNIVSSDAYTEFENTMSSSSCLENSIDKSNVPTENQMEGNQKFINDDDVEHVPKVFREIENLDETCENISSQGNCTSFQGKDCSSKESNNITASFNENKVNLKQCDAVIDSCLKSDGKEGDKYFSTSGAEFLDRQNNKVPFQSSDILDLQLKNSADQYSDCLSPADISFSVDVLPENLDENKSTDVGNIKELSLDNCGLLKNVKDVNIFEFQNSVENTIKTNELPSYTTDTKLPFVQHHDANFNEPQTMIANDHPHDVLYLSKDNKNYPFISKLDNSNIANDINTNTSYYTLNHGEIDIPVAETGIEDSTNSILYEEVAEGKDISEGSLSSKSTEDSSEKDSAISSGGEFSPAYSPGILQEDRDAIWDFQHVSCTNDSEKSGVKDDNVNKNAGSADASCTLLPAIVVSDSDNVNFTIHSANALDTCDNFRYEHNGNIPTEIRASVATTSCDNNYNVL